MAGLGILNAGLLAALTVDGPAEPLWIALLYPAAVCVYVVAGALAWRRRPDNSMGALLMIAGATLLLGGLVNTDVRALVATGQVTQTLILALVVHALVSFPSGRVRGALPRVIVGGAYLLSTVFEAARWLIVPGPEGLFTSLRVSSDAELAEVFADLQNAVAWVLMGLLVILVFQRLRAATGPQRRVLAPVYVWGMLCAPGIPLSAKLFGVSTALTVVQLGVLVMGVPIAFALGIVLGGFRRTAALDELSGWLGTGDHAVSAVADALGDPSVELVRGPPPAATPRRGSVPIEVHGRAIGAIVYDATLIDDPEPVRNAGRVVGLALEHDRLREEIAHAAEDARRSVAQDLHDGLQSKLVLLGIQASLRGDQELREALEAAVTELRELVSRAAPVVVVERGLFRAAEELVAGVPLPVDLQLDGESSTLPAAIQTGAYFIVAEALTNALKHAHARELGVHLTSTGATLRIEVSDDGIGGAEMPGIRERVVSLGGSVSMDSPAGAGTRLVAVLPCG